MEKICFNCSKQFHTIRSKKFCSIECANLVKKKQIRSWKKKNLTPGSIKYLKYNNYNKKYQQSYREKNKEKYSYKNRKEYLQNYNNENKIKIKDYHKRYQQINSEKIKITRKNYYQNNKEKFSYKPEYYARPEVKLKRLQYLQEFKKKHGKTYSRSYWEKNKDRFKKYQLKRKISGKTKEWEKLYRPQYIKKRITTDFYFKFTLLMRSRFRHFLKLKKLKKNNKTMTLIGCSPTELKLHIEKQFKPGMTWKNWGMHGWHIDHIIPLSSVKSVDELEKRKLMHYTNLQPLWAEENWSKNNKLIYEKKDKYF